MDTIPNSIGCDSVITVNLTIGNNSGTENPSACDSYTVPSGDETYTTSGTYPDTIPNAVGCDSIITINLTIDNNSSSISPIACFTYTVPSGDETYVTAGIYLDTILNVGGCDSVLAINLTINTVDTLVTFNDPLLTSNASGAIYQWIDCSDNTPISGATNQSYTGTNNGSYAVIVTQNSCTDTSACYSIMSIGILENTFGNGFAVYPNPTIDNLLIDLGQQYHSISVTIRTLTGQLISTTNFGTAQKMKFAIKGVTGYYFVEVLTTEGKSAIIKVLKN